MPTQDEVWDAADRVLARGELIRVDTVLAELRRPAGPGEPKPVGGTQRTVGPHLLAWRRHRDHPLRPRVEEPPERLQEEHARFIRSLWTAATQEADARMANEREDLAAGSRANEILLVEAMIGLEAAQAEAANARAEAEALRTQVGTLHEQVVRMRERLDHARSQDYWDKVMQESYELLPPDDARSAGWILSELSAGTIRIGRFVKEQLDEPTLRKKLEFRAKSLRYFTVVAEDAYARLPGWNGPLGRKVRKSDQALQERDAPDVRAAP